MPHPWHFFRSTTRKPSESAMVFGIASSLPGRKTAATIAPVPIKNCRLENFPDDPGLFSFIRFNLQSRFSLWFLKLPEAVAHFEHFCKCLFVKAMEEYSRIASRMNAYLPSFLATSPFSMTFCRSRPIKALKHSAAFTVHSAMVDPLR